MTTRVMQRPDEPTTAELAGERWRPFPGFEATYSISDLGRVRRDVAASNTYAGRIMTIQYFGNVPRVVLKQSGAPHAKIVQVNRAMFGAFVRPPTEREAILPTDGNWRNLRLENWQPTDSHQHRIAVIKAGYTAYRDRLRETRRAERRAAMPTPKSVEPARLPTPRPAPRPVAGVIRCEPRPGYEPIEVELPYAQRDDRGRVVGFGSHRWFSRPPYACDPADPASRDEECLRCAARRPPTPWEPGVSQWTKTRNKIPTSYSRDEAPV